MILHNQNEASEGVFIDNLPRNVPYSIHLDSTRPSENNQNLQNPTKRREPHTRTCEKQKTQETVIYSEEGGRERETLTLLEGLEEWVAEKRRRSTSGEWP